jgi:protein O-GlcNAc transferase
MTSDGLQHASELAVEHHRVGRLAEAESIYRQILSQRPETPEILSLLADLFNSSGRHADAIAALTRVIELKPTDPNPLVSLGNAHRQMGNLDGAIDAYRRAIIIQPDFSGALNNLGNALRDTGDLNAALDCFRRSAAAGDDPAIAGNLCFALHFDPSTESGQLRQLHDAWNERFARPLLPQVLNYINSPDPNRRIRIGYVSPDLRNHPVGLFMLPLLANHNRTAFEVYCYSDAVPDLMTRRLAALIHGWRETLRFSDAELAEQIRHDGIDILVDLALHSRGSRLLAFARKPAPVQVCYLGYCSTSGLTAMDYRLSDPFLDPPGIDEHVYIEKTICLPQTYWCYQPILDAPPPGPLPAKGNGFVTFGCLNNFSKVNVTVLEVWRHIIQNTPQSHLIVHSHNGHHRDRILADYARVGISANRIEFVGTQPLARYLETYQRIDIALDPFPFPGATTSLDALWSGVPVVTLAGNTAVSRAGLSILSNVGLAELVSRNTNDYVGTAIQLAADLPRLEDLRASLRQKLRLSPLTNAPRFTRDIEVTFREMWRKWCGK